MDLLLALRTFCAVAAERSFTRGAAATGQPQPVASRRIAALEEHFGTALFIRTSRHVDLSADGERLLPLAREVVSRTDRIDELFTGKAPDLTISVPGELSARSRAVLRRGLGDRRVTFLEDDPAGRVSALSSASAQLAVLAVPADEGEISVRLGVAQHPHHDRDAPFHLDQLRRPVRERDLPPRRLHLLVEDVVPAIHDPLRSAAFAAGLRADQFLTGTPDVEAWTCAHEFDDVVLASERQAAQHDLAWRPLDRPDVHRNYRLGGSDALTAAEREAMLPRLASGLGGRALSRSTHATERTPS